MTHDQDEALDLADSVVVMNAHAAGSVAHLELRGPDDVELTAELPLEQLAALALRPRDLMRVSPRAPARLRGRTARGLRAAQATWSAPPAWSSRARCSAASSERTMFASPISSWNRACPSSRAG